MKKIITALILVTLILTSFSVQLVQHVKADTSEIQVVSYSWYVAPATTLIAENPGDLIAVGEIQNVGSNTVSTIALTGIAFNGTGVDQTELDSNNAYIPISNLPAGQKCPFYVDFIPENSYTNDTSDTSWIPSINNVTMVVANVVDA